MDQHSSHSCVGMVFLLQHWMSFMDVVASYATEVLNFQTIEIFASII